jgi:toxin ParE1/3/4
MTKYKLSNKAVSDLNDIWEYTNEKWSVNQAEKYYTQLIHTFREIAKYPNIGKEYSGIVKAVMGFRIGRHIIFYQKLNEEEILIVRVLHEQMDLKNRVLGK